MESLVPFTLIGSFPKEKGLTTRVTRGWVAGEEYVEICDHEEGRPRIGYVVNVKFLPQLKEILDLLAPERDLSPGEGQGVLD